MLERFYGDKDLGLEGVRVQTLRCRGVKRHWF